MKSIGKNDELIRFLSFDFTLLSANFYRINIHDDAVLGLTIELYIELLYAKGDNHVKLVFSGIEEFSLYYHHTCYFGNIERYKFFRDKERFYISLDPASEDEIIASEDQDFILSNNVEGFLFKDVKD
ncbi:hypothetical protein [Chitinophaga defluvii]|uniref:Immunity protein 10 of polymorphic toxin system n=1 Tax=Chitinophaga defluvii TaxID=3163343 RepID=A0ABV2TFW4_9BACT